MQSVVVLIFIIVSVGTEARTIAVDPCRDNTLMDNLHRRHPNHTTAFYEPHLCDNRLDEGAWYRFESPVTNRMTDTCVTHSHCGTQWPIWMNGLHPTENNPGPLTVTVCVASISGECCSQWSNTTEVKFCKAPSNDSNHFYVYRLKNVPYCDMAYCADRVSNPFITRTPNNVADLLFLGPNAEVTRTDVCGTGTKNFDDFYFECRLVLRNSVIVTERSARYNVSLTFDGRPDKSKPATTVTLNSTSLVAKFPSPSLTGNMAKRVSCQVYSYWEGSRTRSSVLHSSRSYWVGITYNSPSIRQSTGEVILNEDSDYSSVVINFTSTVPLGVTCADVVFRYR